MLARFYAYVHNPNHQPMSTTTATTKQYPATRHSLSCGCLGYNPDCRCRSAELVPVKDLTADDVALLLPFQREEVLTALRCELEQWAPGSWVFVDSENTEVCGTCHGAKGFQGENVGGEEDEKRGEGWEACDDCDGYGCHRVAAAVAGPETHLRTMPLSAVLRQVVGGERATVRPAPAMPRLAARVTATLRPAATAVAEREVA